MINRAGNDSWTPRRFGGDTSRYWQAVLSDLDRLWRTLAGEQVRRENAHRWLTVVGGRELLVALRTAPGADLGSDWRMASTLAKLGWRDPLFWRNAVPALAVPRRRLRRRASPRYPPG